VNEAALTGESIPVEKTVGSRVYAGTMNVVGTLEVEAEKLGRDTTLSRIIELVERAEGSKAPVQRFADRFTAYFMPLVLLVSFTTYLLTGSITSAISVIVVACPCAVATATPLAVLAGSGKAAKKGIIVKGGVYLEELAKIDTLVIDKTGTLTLGQPEVVGFHQYCIHNEAEVIALAAMVEQHSEHPLSGAILRRASECRIEISPHDECQVLPGRGVVARVGESEVMVGNRMMLREIGVSIPETAEAAIRFEEDLGKTPLLVAHDGEFCGVVYVSDRLRRGGCGDGFRA